MLWSSGYIAGTLGVRTVPPLTLTFWRFALAALLLATTAVASGASWPRDRGAWAALIVTGVTLQAVQGMGVYLGLRAGVPAGLSALLLGLSPIAVALAARVTLQERLTGRQLFGSLLGLGGVAIALSGRVSTAGAGAGLAFTLLGVAGFVTGTLYQKRHGAAMDLRAGGCVQFAAAALTVLPLAAIQGPLTIAALGPLAWLTLSTLFPQ